MGQRATPAVEPLVLVVISLGGGLGSLLRYAIGWWWPSQPHQVPWSTFVINVVGCFAIGILMVLITEVWVAHRLLRPFLGIGLLGGFTTFSTYSLEVRRLLQSGAVVEALGYLGGTVVVALGAVVLGMSVTRWATGTARPTS
ncbi:fluoride efflux transporter CrcB [Nocardia sp. NBC_00565]|uniref:fluoride efflux transporter CrcB n=1 Tax=Nocardia sp. NBC_00565 TaxID=2975993 RepID=UPI002E80E7F1|nr:fluoride efflux transporter CrcB [Nocardia sp. NBC_00565]WUC00377.1 fluoride efflux transporter CrcB [Nocardia sp. NBC_00565]